MNRQPPAPNDRRWFFCQALVLALIVLLFGGVVAAQKTSDVVIVDEPSAKDLYLAAQRIQLNADVTGDAVVAGRDIAISGAVSGDVLAAGQTLLVDGRVGDDVRAAGQSLRMLGIVDGHLVAAGRDIEVADNARIEDWAWLAGSRIEVLGSVGDELHVAAQTVIIDGTIKGDAQILAETLILRPNAYINGDLIWRGTSEPQISADATIVGQLVRRPVESSDTAASRARNRSLAILGAAVVAVVIGLLFPGVGSGGERVVWTHPILALAVGLLVVVVTPVISILALVTGIGYMLSFVLLALFVAALLASVALGLLACARVGARSVSKPVTTPWQLIVAVIVCALALWIITWIPGVGGPVTLLLALLGLGTTAIQIYRARRQHGAVFAA